jgi:transcriptional regulator with XRE-family HTH domain
MVLSKVKKIAQSRLKAFADRLRNIRGHREWTQEDLFNASGVSINAIRKYENGRAFPQARSLVALCKALEVSQADLIGENGNGSSAALELAVRKAVICEMEIKKLKRRIAELEKKLEAYKRKK